MVAMSEGNIMAEHYTDEAIAREHAGDYDMRNMSGRDGFNAGWKAHAEWAAALPGDAERVQQLEREWELWEAKYQARLRDIEMLRDALTWYAEQSWDTGEVHHGHGDRARAALAALVAAPDWKCPICGCSKSSPQHQAWACAALASRSTGDEPEDHTEEPCATCAHRRRKHGGPAPGGPGPCDVQGCECKRYVRADPAPVETTEEQMSTEPRETT